MRRDRNQRSIRSNLILILGIALVGVVAYSFLAPSGGGSALLPAPTSTFRPGPTVIQAALDQKRLYISVDDTLVPIQDKEARARPMQGRTQRHKWFISYDDNVRPEMYDIVEREMLQFPNGANDDCVDMLAWAGRLALNLSLPTDKAPPPRPKSWRDSLTVSRGAGRGAMAA